MNLTGFCIPVLIAVLAANSLAAQEEELELIDRVGDLQKQLDSDVVAERDAAEKELIEMGLPILDYLEPATDDSTTDYKLRLNRIRTSLEKIAVNSVTKASTVSASGSMTVGDILKRIKQQTGNDVSVSDVSLLDIMIEVELDQVEFWPALQQVMAKSRLGIDRYGSEQPGQIMLMPVEDEPNKVSLPSNTSRVFQTSVTRVDSSINLVNPELGFTTLNLLVRWEPRLRPISVDIPIRNVSIIDEFGDTLQLAQPERVIYGLVQPEIPEVEFTLQLPRVDRQIENIKTVKATIDAVLPGRTELFRFEKISKLKSGHRINRAGATVTFEGIRKNEDLYGIKMSLSFDEENNALESHQSWVFQNEVYLQNKNREREDAISLETLRQDNEKVTVQYYFVDDPGDRTLVYRTPATIVKLPVDIELKNIPLP